MKAEDPLNAAPVPRRRYTRRIVAGIAGMLLVAVAVAAYWVWPRDAQYYFERGQDRLTPTDEDGTGGDSEGALADFNRAIRLNPNFAAAYLARAQLEDDEPALADFGHAIELDPTNTTYYITRALFWEARNNVGNAVADVDKAIQLSPKDESLFMRRAELKHKAGDFSGMVADMAHAAEVFTPTADALRTKLSGVSPFANNPEQLLNRLLWTYDRALEQNTNFISGYYNRGVIEDLSGYADEALSDFRRCQSFPDAKLRDNAALQIWVVQMKRDGKDAADQELSKHFGVRLKEQPADWEAQIARFLLGQIDEATFLAAAGGPDAERQRSEVWYYAGMKQLLAGNKAAAADDFQKSRMTETRPYAVAISSQIELVCLGK